MTRDEAMRILSARPEYVRLAECDNIRHYISQYIDASNAARLYPGEDPYKIAEDIIAGLNDPELPVSVREMAAYLVAK